MNTLVFGVHHWGDTKNPSKKELNHLNEWRERIYHFIPGSEIFIATGNKSTPSKSPFPANIKVIQNDLEYTNKYSLHTNYFRNGFMTGVWHGLLAHKQWDILLHVQPRVLIGENMIPHFEKFLSNQTQHVIAPAHHCSYGAEIEISFFGMKKIAAQKYATSAIRQSIQTKNEKHRTLACECEAFLMFKDTWFNPWPNVLSTRQVDNYSLLKQIEPPCSLFTCLDEELFVDLPLISCGKHSTVQYVELWKKNHPYTYE